MAYSADYLEGLDNAVDQLNVGYEIIFTLLHADGKWLSQNEIQTRIKNRTQEFEAVDDDFSSIDDDILNVPKDIIIWYRDELEEISVDNSSPKPPQPNVHNWLAMYSNHRDEEKWTEGKGLLGISGDLSGPLVESKPKVNPSTGYKYRLHKPELTELFERIPELTETDLEIIKQKADVPEKVFETNWNPLIPLVLYEVILVRGIVTRDAKKGSHANSWNNDKQWFDGYQSLDEEYELRMSSIK